MKKTLIIAIFALMALASCKKKDDYKPIDPNEVQLTGYTVSAHGPLLKGTITIWSNDSLITQEAYTDKFAWFLHRTLEYNYSDGSTEYVKGSTCVNVLGEEIGHAYVDSVIYSPDSTSITGQAFYNRDNVDEAIPSSFTAQLDTTGIPTEMLFKFKHPDFGYIEFRYHRDHIVGRD